MRALVQVGELEQIGANLDQVAHQRKERRQRECRCKQRHMSELHHYRAETKTPPSDPDT
jgi:hypothetical protein